MAAAMVSEIVRSSGSASTISADVEAAASAADSFAPFMS
jgi:hypothetical protein